MLRDVRPAERGYSRRAVIMASAKGFPRDTLFRLIAGRARQTIHICRRQSISPDMMYNNMAVAGGEPLNRRARGRALLRCNDLLANSRRAAKGGYLDSSRSMDLSFRFLRLIPSPPDPSPPLLPSEATYLPRRVRRCCRIYLDDISLISIAGGANIRVSVSSPRRTDPEGGGGGEQKA